MSTDHLYSIRMRAAAGGPHEAGGKHLSGAERLVPPDQVEIAAIELLHRARERGVPPDFVQLTVERVPATAVQQAPCLPVTTVTAAGPEEARAVAEPLLGAAGVSPSAIFAAFRGMRSGWAPGGGVLAGAVFMEAASGERMGLEYERGVRACGR
jgi:6-carboxyhexanoate--CoA ligase